jgi:hypothetical protein
VPGVHLCKQPQLLLWRADRLEQRLNPNMCLVTVAASATAAAAAADVQLMLLMLMPGSIDCLEDLGEEVDVRFTPFL